MRLSYICAAMVVLAIGTGGCMSSSGDPAAGFMNESVAAAFVPLGTGRHSILSAHGSGVVMAPGIAVTNAHNDNIVDADSILGISPQYDLLFFRVGHGNPLAVSAPRVGEQVVAYGEGRGGDLRVSHGVIRKLQVPVRPACPVCAIQEAFTFEGNAGPGFSGGPVLDAQDGRLVGITFGYDDEADGTRVMYAYDMARVNAEFSLLQPHFASNRE